MFDQTFYNRGIRKYIILFGTLFNKIYINRYQLNTDEKSLDAQQTLKVPLSYGPKSKYLNRTMTDSDLNQQIATILPRMSYEMVGIQYAPDRKNNTLNRRKNVGPDGNLHSMFEPVPYDIDFTLYIMTHYAEDATQIIEQIVPYFTPEWTSTIQLDENIDYRYDIKIGLRSVSFTDSYEGDLYSRRTLIWTLTFNMKAMILGNVKNNTGGCDGDSGGVIKFIQLDFHNRPTPLPILPPDVNIPGQEIIHVYPGLTSNGSPTTDKNQTIPWEDIGPDDDYGFIIDYFRSV